MKTLFTLFLFILLVSGFPSPGSMLAQGEPIYITEINISNESLPGLEVHIYNAATNGFLGCSGSLGCVFRSNVLYEVERSFIKSNGVELSFNEIANLNILLRVIRNDSSAACPGEAQIPPDNLVATSPSFAASDLNPFKIMQFGSINHLKLGTARAPLPPPGSPEVDIKEIQVLGINDGIGRLEIEVHIHEAGTNRFLGCSGQINGLEDVDQSGTLYNVNARFHILRNRNMVYDDIQDKTIYAVVIEDDLNPCPCEPGFSDDDVATSAAFPGTDLQAAQEIRNIGSLGYMVIGLAGMPSRVILATPPDLSVINTEQIIFSWVPPGTGIEHYQFQLASDSSMTNILVDSLVAGPTLILSGVNAGLTQNFHWWRVRAKNNIGWGLFSRRNNFIYLGPVTGIDSPEPIAGEFFLGQNYPNPFNPQTTIRYGLAKAGNVLLQIFNSRGQKIRTLVNQFESAGAKTVVWDGRNDAGQSVASGVYFYRISAPEGFVQMKKMLLVK